MLKQPCFEKINPQSLVERVLRLLICSKCKNTHPSIQLCSFKALFNHFAHANLPDETRDIWISAVTLLLICLGACTCMCHVLFIGGGEVLKCCVVVTFSYPLVTAIYQQTSTRGTMDLQYTTLQRMHI